MLQNYVINMMLLPYLRKYKEHIVYDGLSHIPVASLDNMKDRTITISGFPRHSVLPAGESDTRWRRKILRIV